MGRGALDADVAAAHDARLAAVEGEFELALEDDAVVDGHGAVEGGLEAGAEVDEADDGAVGDVEAGLDGEVGEREGEKGKRKKHTSFSRAYSTSLSPFSSTGVSFVEYDITATACFSPMTRWWSPASVTRKCPLPSAPWPVMRRWVLRRPGAG